MINKFNTKKVQNRKYELSESLLLEWDHLYSLVHNKELVMHKRKLKSGKVIHFLDFEKNERK